MTTALTQQLNNRLRQLRSRTPGRPVLGITGCPGAGKSTLSEWVLSQEPDAAWLPMDGFHLADNTLDQLGARSRKGAIDTFDGYGYLATIRRIKTERRNIVYGPSFDRELEQPLAAGMAILPTATLLITEGNYLLADDAPWSTVREELDEVWFIDVPDGLRRERLIERHIRFGKTPAAARSWVDTVDESNAHLIAATRERADLIIPLEDLYIGASA